jgi:hypothetical protein
MLKNPICESCFSAAECLTYHLGYEKGTEETSGVPSLFRYLTSHITQAQLSYFLHWDYLIRLESLVSDTSLLSQLWNSDAELIPRLRIIGVTWDDGVTITLNQTRATTRLSLSFQTGDNVSISLEKLQSPSAQKCLVEIEDLSRTTNISSVDPYLTSGIVLEISQCQLVVKISQPTNRFRRYLDFFISPHFLED